MRPLWGFSSNTLAANDDDSTGAVPLGFEINFFGGRYSSVYVNNNGNITFNGSQGTYTPYGLTGGVPQPIIAPFFADVDTRAGNLMTYGTDFFANGRKVFGVNWMDVGYYASHTDKLNSFQLVLIDRSETGEGNFDIEFNYNKVQWETGDASSGSGGMGGNSVHAGYSAGTGAQGSFFELAGSGVNGAMIDGGGNALTSNKRNSTRKGRYRFQVRNGVVEGSGRLMKPQNQTVTPFAPQRVAAMPGEELPAQVEEIGGEWAQGPGLCEEDAADDTPVAGAVTYRWTSSGGTFAEPNEAATTWTAPEELDDYTLTCTIDDAARNIHLVREVVVHVMAPSVEFSGAELVHGTLRACAGGIDDHDKADFQYRAHTRKVDLTVKLDGKIRPDTKFTLRFTGNKGHGFNDNGTRRLARLHRVDEPFDAAHGWKDTLEVTADAQGKVSVWVLSSDVINKPMLQAILKPVPEGQTPVKLGEIECDFAASMTFRNFMPLNAKGEPLMADENKDYGWIF